MTVLIDPPLWPAHGTLWSHVVSDHSLDELHEFAARNDLPARSFDLDHYDVPADRHDVPADRHDALVAAGAEPVTAGDLVRRLIASGLRITERERRASRGDAPS
ncbi:DUF4031 domain-containing protein [Plantibacter flavus]|uniref:DUF4031 domain-containing protein n=1 Tax=Plantibacter flavus TaxID=150123 RepID=UPI003F17F849